MPSVTLTPTGASPLSTAVIYTVAGSPNPNENGNYDLTFFDVRGRLSRILKKRYCTLLGVHVRSVNEVEAVNQQRPI
jgi:hypothetical protein